MRFGMAFVITLLGVDAVISNGLKPQQDFRLGKRVENTLLSFPKSKFQARNLHYTFNSSKDFSMVYSSKRRRFRRDTSVFTVRSTLQILNLFIFIYKLANYPFKFERKKNGFRLQF